MPLIHSKSKKAFHANVAREVHAGKDMKQAVAIAYSIKKRAGKNYTDEDIERARKKV